MLRIATYRVGHHAEDLVQQILLEKLDYLKASVEEITTKEVRSHLMATLNFYALDSYRLNKFSATSKDKYSFETEELAYVEDINASTKFIDKEFEFDMNLVKKSLSPVTSRVMELFIDESQIPEAVITTVGGLNNQISATLNAEYNTQSRSVTFHKNKLKEVLADLN
jgi:hypothetical protein